MSESQNGWPVVGQGAIVDRAILGVEFPNGWLRGDVDVVFTYLIGRLHREVEPMLSPGCWGWFVKNIEGSTSISNHASGTAIDYNAPNHPMGTRNTYPTAKRARIRAILADLDGVVRWGGDYTGRPDDMHFEINTSAAAVKRVAAQIKGAAPVATDLNNNTVQRAVFDDQLLDANSIPKDGGAAGATVTVKEALRQVQVTKNRVTEAFVGPALDGGPNVFVRLAALEGHLEYLRSQVDRLLSDPADDPSNPIVVAVRYANDHPTA